MIADRWLAVLRERMGFVVTTWSLVRIGLVTVAALVVAGLVIPSHPADLADSPYGALATKHTRNVSLPFGDTRGFQPTSHPHAFRVAWVGGSETLSVGKGHRGFIADLVGDRLGQVDGKNVSTDVFYLDAIRLADELTALSTAIESKPDVVVVSLNPVWVLNDLAAQQWGYLDGTLARHSSWPPSRWPVAASFVSPGDVGWKALSRLSPSAVADRYDHGVELADKTSDLSFLDAVEGVAPPELTEMQALGAQRPVDFFFSQYLKGRSAGMTLTEQQFAILGREVASKSEMNRTILREMFEMVRRAGVDAYFYMPPINPEVYAEPQAKAYLGQLREQLASATAGQTTGRVRFDPQGLQDRVPPTEYEDIVHVLNGADEADVLAGDICDLLVSGGRRAGCEKQ
jgi:hypothetical protein